jgi:hypothetical protein
VPGETVQIWLSPVGGDSEAPGEAPVARLLGPATTPGGPPAEILVPLTPSGDGFAARLPAPGPGLWRLETARGPESSQVDSGDLQVLPPALETRDPRADRAGLEAFVAACGGQLFDDVGKLAAALPRELGTQRSIVTANGLWDRPWTLALLVVLLGIELALRRWNRMP